MNRDFLPGRFTYGAKVLRVVDGDTLDLEVDLGFRVRVTQRFRLLDYNAPEMTGPERALGFQAALALSTELPVGSDVVVRSEKGDAFGRWLCELWTPSLVNFSVAATLTMRGYGVRWDGRGKRPGFDPSAPYPLVPCSEAAMDLQRDIDKGPRAADPEEG